MRRGLAWTLVIITGLLLQSTVFTQVRLGGATPELMYLITVIMAMIEGPSTGAVAGFSAGMGQDILLDQPAGITALTLTLVGYAVGMIRQYIVTPSPVLPVVLVGGATVGGVLFYGLVSFLLGQPVGFAFLLKTALLSGLYNAVLTPILYPVLRRVAEASRAKKVFRW